MVTIFTASGDRQSFQHSSRIIAPLLHWLLPHLSEHTVYNVVLVFRKCAHLTEYAILAFLVWRATRKLVWRDKRPWQWSEAGVALWVAALYASTDEFHQTFVPSREGCLRDVLIDSSGALIGLLALYALGRWLKFW
ncbi:VanZ family protein [Pedosphaera parvula Ellin514]|uniref:VanZ family protein n=2 Tax=Pedosphaera TaxID=1032526 RepID=B9XPA0_PEDPL|nr:VanZ family protein [Pedosphaera parvula Ellin514]